MTLLFVCLSDCEDLSFFAFSSSVSRNLVSREDLQGRLLTTIYSIPSSESPPLSSLDMKSYTRILLHFSLSLSWYANFLKVACRSCNFYNSMNKYTINKNRVRYLHTLKILSLCRLTFFLFVEIPRRSKDSSCFKLLKYVLAAAMPTDYTSEDVLYMHCTYNHL